MKILDAMARAIETELDRVDFYMDRAGYDRLAKAAAESMADDLIEALECACYNCAPGPLRDKWIAIADAIRPGVADRWR